MYYKQLVYDSRGEPYTAHVVFIKKDYADGGCAEAATKFDCRLRVSFLKGLEKARKGLLIHWGKHEKFGPAEAIPWV